MAISTLKRRQSSQFSGAGIIDHNASKQNYEQRYMSIFVNTFFSYHPSYMNHRHKSNWYNTQRNMSNGSYGHMVELLLVEKGKNNLFFLTCTLAL